MSIVNSSYTVGHEQADGTRLIVETHIDSEGEVHKRRYFAEPGMDYDAILAARIVELNEWLAAREIEALLNG
jgi:hypothetical protein